MKKLLVAVLAMATVSAYAQKHMVRFSTIGNHNGSDDFNIAFDTSDADGTESSQTSIALNYAYTIAPMWQLGLEVDYQNGDEAKSIAYTVAGYYNFSTDLANAWYAGLRYTIGNSEDNNLNTTGDSTNDFFSDADRSVIALEAGKRFALGSWDGFNLSYAPNVQLAQESIDYDEDGADDLDVTTLTWNFLKFDVLF